MEEKRKYKGEGRKQEATKFALSMERLLIEIGGSGMKRKSAAAIAREINRRNKEEGATILTPDGRPEWTSSTVIRLQVHIDNYRETENRKPTAKNLKDGTFKAEFALAKTDSKNIASVESDKPKKP